MQSSQTCNPCPIFVHPLAYFTGPVIFVCNTTLDQHTKCTVLWIGKQLTGVSHCLYKGRPRFRRNH